MPIVLCRNETLGQFAVLNVQIQNLTSEMRPLLKHYLAHPCSVSAEIAAGAHNDGHLINKSSVFIAHYVIRI